MLLAYFIFVHLILLIPGYALAKNIKFLQGKPSLELCAAYLVSMLGLGVLSICGYVFDIPRLWLHSIPWVFICFGLYFFVKQRLYLDLMQHRLPLAALLGISIFSCAFISLQLSGSRPFYPDPQSLPQNNYQVFNVKVLNVAQTPANDNYVPYRQAQFIINRSDPAKDSFIDEWGVHFFQRTPLMGAVTAGFFNLLGDTPPIPYLWGAGAQDPDNTYLKFQIIGQIMNGLFILPGFFLLSRLFNRKTAMVSLLFIIPSAFFLYNSFFTWPKSLVAFFVLFSWMLLFERRFRYLLLAGAVSGTAYLAHDLAILYLGASVILLLYWRRFRDILVFTGLNVLFFIPWLATSALIYKKPSTFPLYPFSLHGIPQAGQAREIIKEYFSTSPLHILWLKTQFLFYLLSPYQLLFSEGGQELGRRIWAATLFNLSGGVGFGLMLAVFLGFIKRARFVELWILILVPVLGCVFLIGWPKGLGALHFAEASTVLAIGLGAWFLLSLKNKWWAMLAFGINIAQVVFIGVYSYFYRVGPWLTNLHDLAALTLVLGVIGACAVALYAVLYDKTNALRSWLRRLVPKY